MRIVYGCPVFKQFFKYAGLTIPIKPAQEDSGTSSRSASRPDMEVFCEPEKSRAQKLMEDHYYDQGFR